MENYYLKKGISLPESYTYVNLDNKTDNLLDNLSRVNLFIGENNSGKSRLIRELFSKKSLFIPNYPLDIINQSNKKFKEELTKYGKKNSITYVTFEKVLHLENLKDILFIDESFEIIEYILSLKDIIDKEYIKKTSTSYSNITFPEVGQDLLKIYNGVYKEIFDIHEKIDLSKKPFYKKIYIPILRGLRPIAATNDYIDIYSQRTKEVYFKELPENCEIFTGLSIYDEVKRHKLGSHKMIKLITDYERYLSENFFNNKTVVLVPNAETNYLTIKIGNETERPIYELGDGLQTIIIITFPLFINKEKQLILYVDEPEQYLHPGLQRMLLNTLINEDGFELFQYFITTHSNHFLDLTLDFNDISIYTIKKDMNNGNGDEINPKFIIENLTYGDVNFLQTLGVRNSSVFLSNCTIWVEGITDRWYYRKYLEIYMNDLHSKNTANKSYIEDYHYSFVEYAGANITHWSVLDREENPINVDTLCGKLYLIKDNDNKKGNPTDEELEKNLKNRYYILECKEVENLISPTVLKNILIANKETNIPDLIYKDYKKKNLGKYIDDRLASNNKHVYTDGNTISNKLGFCKKALLYINSIEDMTPESIKIAETLYEFIKAKNELYNTS